MIFPSATTFLLLLSFTSRVSLTTPPSCKCQTEDDLRKSGEHLQLVAKISAMKLVASVRDLVHHATNERNYVLDLTKYEVVRDLQNTYGKLITHTDFHRHWVEMVDEIRKIMASDEVPAIQSLQQALAEAVDRSLSKALPSAFLCLSMGECLSAPPPYVQCMAENAHNWTVHFGKEPEKMSRRLAESVGRYKLLEKRLLSLQELLIGAEKSISSECAQQYSSVTQCGLCVSERVGYCRDSCQNVAGDCFLKIASEWDEHIAALDHLAKDYDDGFYPLERGIHNSLRRLVEHTSPNLAWDVVNTCGTLGQDNVLATTAILIENKKPRTVVKKTQRLVQQLQSYRGYWRRLSDKLCSDPSQENFCWNGTNIVRAISTIEELPEITKNVRPRPKDPMIEGSGSPVSWSDDEDLTEGSGSGAPVEDPIVDIFATTPRLPPIGVTTVASTTLKQTPPPPPTTTTTAPVFIEQDVYEVSSEDRRPDASASSLVSLVVSAVVVCWLL